MRKFLTWLTSPPGPGVIVADWLTPEESEQCANGDERQFWGWYQVALSRKNTDEFLRGLCWTMILAPPFLLGVLA